MSGQPSRASNIITTESPIRTSACPMPPSGPAIRASSCPPNAEMMNSMSWAESAEMIHGVTAPYPAGWLSLMDPTLNGASDTRPR